jgi:hypothetical protein
LLLTKSSILVFGKIIGVWAACLLLDYPEWAKRGTGIDHGDYVTCMPYLDVRAACLLLNYPEWAERGMGIDFGDYMTCLPHLVCLPLVIYP